MTVKFSSVFLILILFMTLSQTLLAAELETSQPAPLSFEDRPYFQRYSPNDPHYGGTLVWGVIHAPTIINPVLTQHSVSASLLELIFDSLVRLDDRGEIVPGLARSWDVAGDGLSITFHLHQGVRFHDGVELTAEDVKFTYDQIADPLNKSPWLSGTRLTERWEIVDSYTVRVILKKPFVPIGRRLTREIVPKHLLADQDLHDTIFNKAPVGTGPFKFQSWDKNVDEIRLTANENYFEGRPYLNEIIVKTFSDNSRLWAALLRHEVDLVQYISEENYEVLKNDPTFKAYAISWGMCLVISYNLNDSILSDRNIRLAIAHGTNVPEMMGFISEVSGVVSAGPFPPDSPGFNPDVKPLEFDPAKAKQILHQQGWRDTNGDGIVENNGKRLEIKLLVDERNYVLKKIAKIIRQQMAEIGIKITVILYQDEGEFVKGNILNQRPQAWLRYLSGPDLGGYEIARDWYSGSTEFAKIWKYNDRTVNALFKKARSAQNEIDRSSYFREIHQRIYREQPVCFLFYPRVYFAVNAKFQNTSQYFSKYNLIYTIKNWFINN